MTSLVSAAPATSSEYIAEEVPPRSTAQPSIGTLAADAAQASGGGDRRSLRVASSSQKPYGDSLSDTSKHLSHSWTGVWIPDRLARVVGIGATRAPIGCTVLWSRTASQRET